MTKAEHMANVAAQVETMLHSVIPDSATVAIRYDVPTADTIDNYDVIARQLHHITANDEYFLILDRIHGEKFFLMYAVNVSGDSVLTATAELLSLIARKF